MTSNLIQRIQELLEDLDYPAGKDEILATAQRNGADERTLRALRALPPVDYRNEAELLRSVDVDPAELEGRRPSDKARQRREHTHPRLAEHMKDVGPLPLETDDE